MGLSFCKPFTSEGTVALFNGKKATYRCQMKPPLEMYYDQEVSDKKIYEYSYKLCREEIIALIELKPFFVSRDSDGIVKFRANDSEITDFVKHYFTPHPTGWSEPAQYEEINFPGYQSDSDSD